jgi:transcriptional regulator with XRE-family HTH domain
MIRSVQITAARSLLRLSLQQLADMAEIGISSAKRAENAGNEVPAISAKTLAKIETALHQAGVVFLDDHQSSPIGGPGVRIRTILRRPTS